MTATLGPTRDPDAARPSVRPGFRDDIQGLRAVAVLLVLGYHAGVPQLAGGFVGVDVFLVISGYLITGLILREVERTGTLHLPSFYARRARRLLPATAVVLTASALITVLVVPVTRWATIVWDLATSALYVTNWWLADQAVEYLAADTPPSPVQHFWTLAVEEQFYLVWPVLLLVLLALHRRTGVRLRPLLLSGITLLAVASLVWSVHLTATEPGRAYFVSTTRVWEMALGAMLAFTGARTARLGPTTRGWLATGGMAAILYAAVTFDASTPFPGSAALLPTVGTVAILAAGAGGQVRGVSALLTNRPMIATGALSYSLYLWHWPLLVGAREVWADPGQPLPVTTGLLVVAASAVPAFLTFRFVEAPIHHARWLAHHPRRNGLVAAVCTAVGVAAAVAVAVAMPASEPAFDGDRTAAAGARAVVGDGDGGADPATYLVDQADFVPDAVSALDDLGGLGGERCIQPSAAVEIETCTYGRPDADTRVAVVGDSKMHQWLPAIETIADERGWLVVTFLKSGCPLVRVPTGRDGVVDRACVDHNQLRYDELLAGGFDLVLTSQRASQAFLPGETLEDRRQAMVDDLSRTWRDLEARGTDVVVVLDNPDPGVQIPDCVAANLDQLSTCGFPLDAGLSRSASPIQLAALEDVPQAGAVELHTVICPGEICPAVFGDVLLYRQGSHLTATYVVTLSDRFDRAIQDAIAAR